MTDEHSTNHAEEHAARLTQLRQRYFAAVSAYHGQGPEVRAAWSALRAAELEHTYGPASKA